MNEKRIQELKHEITRHNSLYRKGKPEITDEEYDSLLEELEILMDDPVAFMDFKDTLFEEAGDVKHEYVIGSLRKCKYEDNDIVKYTGRVKAEEYLAMDKIDGMSFVGKYVNRKYASAATRGNGLMGEDITEQCRVILPPTIDQDGIVYIRGELTLTNEDYTVLGYKNRRNGTVGVVKKDTIIPERLKYVKAIVYQILGSELPRIGQLLKLQALGFQVPRYKVFPASTPDMNEALKLFLDETRLIDEYDIDGLVVCGISYVAENVKHPNDMVAFKLNNITKETKIRAYELNVSKGGRVVPTILVEPVDICGITVNRITGNNFYGVKGVVTRGLGVGATIVICRSGDVIPKIVSTVEPAEVEIPTVCPCCKEPVSRRGADIVCTNPDCGDTALMKVLHLIRKYEVEGASEVSLEAWGIDSIDALIEFKPTSGHPKNAHKFYESLNKMLFGRLEPNELMGRMPTHGIGERTYAKLNKHFGGITGITEALHSEAVFAFNDMLPEGIGIKTLQKLALTWENNVRLVFKILGDPRAKIVEKKAEEVRTDTAIAGKTFLFTGTLTQPRKHFEKIVTSNGGVLSSGVNKDLNYLVVGEDAGSKLEKAEKLNASGKANIQIIDEDAFAKLVK